MNKTEYLTAPLRGLGHTLFAVLLELGRWMVFLARGLGNIFTYPVAVRKFVDQVYFIGTKSILVIVLTAAFTGMVLGLQGYYVLVMFGSEGLLGTMVTNTLVRELGPVFTAIMVTGRAGSAMAAEIGIMRNSEQIDALETMDINPIRFLFSPRLAAAIFSFPLLTAIYDFIGIMGGFLTGSVLLQLSPGIYFSSMQSNISMYDVNGGFIKSLIFGVVVTTVCCYQGYYTHLREEGFGARGVSNATTSAVVISFVLILVTDYVATSFLL